MTALIILNDEMDGIVKINEFLEESGLLIGVRETDLLTSKGVIQ